MSTTRCAFANCNANRLAGKAYCLEHHQSQDYTFGMDYELKKKMQAKFDPKKEAEAKSWFEALTGKRCQGTFQEWLKNGVILCQAVNKIKPGSVKSISTSGMPFKQMENIDSYLKACRALGVKDINLFMTRDLFENANMLSVVQNIHQLGSMAQKVSTFKGPYLGVKVADEQRRNFSEEFLKEHQSGSRQTSGDHGFQEDRDTHRSRQIITNVTVAGAQVRAAEVPTRPAEKPKTVVAARPAAPAPAPVPVAAPAPAPAASSAGPKFCGDCGSKREGIAKFCPNCGTRF